MAHRIAHSTRHIDKFGPGLDGFREKLLTPPIPATVVTAEWLDDQQENVCRAVTRAGFALEAGNYEQLGDAIERQVESRATAMALVNQSLLATSFSGATATALIALGTRLIVGCSNGAIYTSDDYGGTWTSRTSNTAKGIYAFASNGSIVVAVCADREIVTSPDGATWTARTSGVLTATSDILDVVWDSVNGLFIAVGDVDPTYGLIITSPDGVTWARQTAHLTGPIVAFSRIATGGGKSCAISQGLGTYVSFTTNGTTWGAGVNPSVIQTHKGVEYLDGRFVILATGTTYGRSATTTDGVTFTNGTELGAADGVFGGYGIVIADAIYAAAGTKLYRSYDGLTWTRVGYLDSVIGRPVLALGRVCAPTNVANQLVRSLALGVL